MNTPLSIPNMRSGESPDESSVPLTFVEQWLPRLHELLTERPELATDGIGGTVLAAVMSS